MSLFESNEFILHRFLFYPGGILRYAGTFLTQFLYYPPLGATLFITLWLLLIWISKVTFKLSNSLYPLTFLVPLCLLVSVVQLDEAWLSLKSPGYIFSNTLGYLATVALYYLFQKAIERPVLAAISALISVCLYPLLGFYALLAGVLCVMEFITEGIRQKGYVCYTMAALALVFVVIIPQLYYMYFPGNTVDNDYLYLKGLPELVMLRCDVYLWIPFIVASSILILSVWLKYASSAFLNNGRLTLLTGLALVVAAVAWTLHAEKKSEHIRATVLMLRAIERNDWQGVINIMARTRETPNYTMLVLTNLAKVNLGEKRMDISDVTPLNLDGRHSETFTMTAFIQVPVNYYIGRFNQSYRWAMEHTVQYGSRVFFLKYMVKDALMNGEVELAKKYNDVLLSTIFHKKWAEEMNRYIENPDLIQANPEFKEVSLMNKQEENREKFN